MLIRTCAWLLCLSALCSAQESSAISLNEILAIASSAGIKTELPAQSDPRAARYEYRLVATSKTSTAQKEMNEAAQAGFRFGGVMGGATAFGGAEVVVVMWKDPAADSNSRFEYKLLATNKTSTMQKELQEAGDGGFEYKGQSVAETAFGGKEVIVILERNQEVKLPLWEYKLLATSKTSTMQKELSEAGAAGFSFVGITVAQTSFGGKEVVCILRRPRS